MIGTERSFGIGGYETAFDEAESGAREGPLEERFASGVEAAACASAL